jgi:hypothetical protein
MSLTAPSGLDQINEFYGNALAYYGDRSSWEQRILGVFTLPYDLFFAGRTVTHIRAHHKVGDLLVACFEDILRQGLAPHVQQYGGCYSYRLKRTNGHELSVHSWAAAIDLEPALYPLGSFNRFHPEVVSIFTRRGFVYGGDFQRTKDPMHFQFVRSY